MWMLPIFFRDSQVKDVLAYIVGILLIPSLLLFSLFKGVWGAMHDISFKRYIIASFIFYSLLIALIQIIIYKRRERKKSGNRF
jgi:hypothetical protein